MGEDDLQTMSKKLTSSKSDWTAGEAVLELTLLQLLLVLRSLCRYDKYSDSKASSLSIKDRTCLEAYPFVKSLLQSKTGLSFSSGCSFILPNRMNAPERR